MFRQDNLNDYIVSPSDTLRTAMEKIDRNKHRVVIVVQDKQVLGTVSDGDLRRAFLHHALEITLVKSIMNLNCKTTTETDPQRGLKVLQTEKVTVLPVVDSDNQFIGLYAAFEPDFTNKK